MVNVPFNKIYLVGFMGSGKTTVGKILSKKLKYPFVDLDNEIEFREGLSIPQIFNLKGEQYFRKLEREVLEDVTENLPKFVMATGGGLGANPAAMEYMKKHGIVIWLDVDFETFLKRTQRDPNRPLLRKPVEELKALFEKRKEVYSRAHIRIRSQRSPEDTAKKVIETLKTTTL